ncbi:hypothetical protein E3P92_03236 [Wallemia ichthyophaga]|uniref:(2E,6E)-farnesyl diphosphate synthase n=1 Tax=Wallemia ichthyophaga TaxID=245174 RepID=A0A4T0H393_WALIC|nr:hypothetical protein E3P91_03218 [Wallemia ichthyophaga]TIA79613.1 hypothetical protein E3P98_03203 [Wallemia ichthyophaga]TIA96730.1 hypothetical protein E3P95_03161 [Wallemia ichthyophaga]TIA97995.1 hypothetical protein E3P94_03121 [Wallemia ichthyophaga]TIB09516.1 hypothetical protein E3P93_03147 [Wallemia ichthyophaga]
MINRRAASIAVSTPRGYSWTTAASLARAAAAHKASSPITVDPFTLVGKELKGLTTNIKMNLGSNLRQLDTLSKYYFEAPGKHLRPTIVLLMAQATANLSPHYNTPKHLINVLVNDPLAPQSILHDTNPSFHNDISQRGQDGVLPTQRRLAEIVEMIHVASLLHDDVVDDADTRRGAPSAPVHFGNKLTIFAGDFLLGRASIMLARLRSLEVAELVGATIANLVQGEVEQLNETYQSSSNDLNTVVDEAFQRYLAKTYLKTASLISHSARAAVCLGGVGVNENWAQGEYLKDAAYDYGRNLGMAFQLVDDLLDYTPSADLGKPGEGADMQLGLATAPALFAWRELGDEMGTMIKRKFKHPGDVQKAKALVAKSNGMPKTAELAASYIDKAKSALHRLPKSDARDGLEALCLKVLDRVK